MCVCVCLVGQRSAAWPGAREGLQVEGRVRHGAFSAVQVCFLYGDWTWRKETAAFAWALLEPVCHKSESGHAVTPQPMDGARCYFQVLECSGTCFVWKGA